MICCFSGRAKCRRNDGNFRQGRHTQSLEVSERRCLTKIDSDVKN